MLIFGIAVMALSGEKTPGKNISFKISCYEIGSSQQLTVQEFLFENTFPMIPLSRNDCCSILSASGQNKKQFLYSIVQQIDN